MTIASEITDLQTNLTAAKNAVTAKGGTVGNTGLAGLASEIAGIPSGGGSTPTFARVEFYPYIRPDSIDIYLARDNNGHYTISNTSPFITAPSGVQVALYDSEIDNGAVYWGVTPSDIKYVHITAFTSPTTDYGIEVSVEWMNAGGETLGGDVGQWNLQRDYWGFQIQGADTTGAVNTMDFNWAPLPAEGWTTPSTAEGFKWFLPQYAIKQVTFTQSS